MLLSRNIKLGAAICEVKNVGAGSAGGTLEMQFTKDVKSSVNL